MGRLEEDWHEEHRLWQGAYDATAASAQLGRRLYWSSPCKTFTLAHSPGGGSSLPAGPQRQQHGNSQEQQQHPQAQQEQDQQPQQQHEHGWPAPQNPGHGSARDPDFNFPALTYLSGSITSASNSVRQHGTSGGGCPLPLLIQAEPVGGAGQQTSSGASTSSRPVVQRLESFLISKEPASVAAAAVVPGPAPIAASQIHSFRVQQSTAAPSTSSQYPSSDGHGLQASVSNPALQQHVKQQLATQLSTTQDDAPSYRVAQTGSIEQGPAARFTNDTGSTDLQQTDPQSGNPPACKQQVRDDEASSSMLQQAVTQGSYVDQTTANCHHTDARGSYGSQSVNQGHDVRAGLQQRQSTMAAAPYPPQLPEDGSSHAARGVGQQGAPAAVQQPQIGAPLPCSDTGTSQRRAPGSAPTEVRSSLHPRTNSLPAMLPLLWTAIPDGLKAEAGLRALGMKWGFGR